jgi:glutamyl-tRNA(Gln) amidotransferase subunit E
LGGYVADDEGRVGIRTITLEEDSARKVKESDGVVTYCLDRLGIPLIEISTAPDIHSPDQAERVAQRIGLIMRLTGRVKRGLGTIRQDLNVSIRGGAKIEIKGVQRLDLISKVVALEAYRQYRLLRLRDEIAGRGLDRSSVSMDNLVDVTDLFRGSGVRFIRRIIDRGGVVVALPLKGFKGLLGWSIGGGRRFGSELADYAKQWGGVGGLIHSDELPGYGIDRGIVDEIYRRLDLDPDADAFILISDSRDRVLRAFKAVVERIRMAFDGVPEETRVAVDDGTTRYMRPQPGAARMYPETDIPPVRVDSRLLEEARRLVPEPLEVKFERFIRDHGLSRDLAQQLIRSHYLPLYEDLQFSKI